MGLIQMSNEFIFTGICIAVMLMAMVYQTYQIQELYKLFAMKIESDNLNSLMWKETREERKEF